MAVNGANRDNRRNTLKPMMRHSASLGKQHPFKSRGCAGSEPGLEACLVLSGRLARPGTPMGNAI